MKLVAVSRGFAYPVGESLALVRKAGGLRGLSESERKRVKFKAVAIGEDCSDMPNVTEAERASVALRLERGEIAIVEEKD